ncbi:MAG: hypothetical protein OXG04_13490 [Acidobacteria bacterium]|nr:hypothetical protein [Acidobacteriota bacterium]
MDLTTPPPGKLSDLIELAIPIPACSEFNTWNTLDAHLDSMADRAKQLRKLGL